MNTGLLALTGTVNAAFNTSRLVLEHTSEDYSNGTPTWENRVESYFTCLGDIGYSDDTTPSWRLSICQPETYNGQLASEFVTVEQVSSYIAPEYRGTTYLMMNITSGSSANCINTSYSEDTISGDVTGSGYPPDEYINQKEWLGLILKPKADQKTLELQLSVTLCYTAFDTAELKVEAMSTINRTEPGPVYDSERNTHNCSDVRRQFGQPPDGSLLYSEGATSRGTMQLHQRNSWLPGDKTTTVRPGYVITQPHITEAQASHRLPLTSQTWLVPALVGPSFLTTLDLKTVQLVPTSPHSCTRLLAQKKSGPI